MGRILEKFKPSEETSDTCAPETASVHHAPDKVRVFLMADAETKAQLVTIQDDLRDQYGPSKLRRIYDDITGIPIATLGTETQLRRIARRGKNQASNEPDFLDHLADSLIGDNALPIDEVTFSSPHPEWAKADRTSMLISRFDSGDNPERCATIKNELLRNLQQHLLGVNSRHLDDLMRLGGVDWIHQPAPFLPHARPYSWLTTKERIEIEQLVSERLPEEMHFFPYVYTPEPLDYEALAREIEEEADFSQVSLRQDLGCTALSLIERAYRVKDTYPEARVELIDKRENRTFTLEPGKRYPLRQETGAYCLAIDYHPEA